MIRAMVVEDDRWVRETVAAFLRRSGPEVELAAACADAGEAIRFVDGGGELDVALVDLGLPDRPGLEVIAHLRRARPSVVAVAFTVFDDAPTVLAALRAGARGYLLKQTPIEQLIEAIRAAATGGAPMTPSVANLMITELLRHEPARAAEPELPSLTRRESDVLRLLAKGLTYAEAAGVLGISLNTVQTYVKTLYEKLEINSKAEAAALAVKLGLL